MALVFLGIADVFAGEGSISFKDDVDSVPCYSDLSIELQDADCELDEEVVPAIILMGDYVEYPEETLDVDEAADVITDNVSYDEETGKINISKDILTDMYKNAAFDDYYNDEYDECCSFILYAGKYNTSDVEKHSDLSELIEEEDAVEFTWTKVDVTGPYLEFEDGEGIYLLRGYDCTFKVRPCNYEEVTSSPQLLSAIMAFDWNVDGENPVEMIKDCVTVSDTPDDDGWYSITITADEIAEIEDKFGDYFDDDYCWVSLYVGMFEEGEDLDDVAITRSVLGIQLEDIDVSLAGFNPDEEWLLGDRQEFGKDNSLNVYNYCYSDMGGRFIIDKVEAYEIDDDGERVEDGKNIVKISYDAESDQYTLKAANCGKAEVVFTAAAPGEEDEEYSDIDTFTMTITVGKSRVGSWIETEGCGTYAQGSEFTAQANVNFDYSDKESKQYPGNCDENIVFEWTLGEGDDNVASIESDEGKCTVKIKDNLFTDEDDWSWSIGLNLNVYEADENGNPDKLLTSATEYYGISNNYERYVLEPQDYSFDIDEIDNDKISVPVDIIKYSDECPDGETVVVDNTDVDVYINSQQMNYQYDVEIAQTAEWNSATGKIEIAFEDGAFEDVEETDYPYACYLDIRLNSIDGIDSDVLDDQHKDMVVSLCNHEFKCIGKCTEKHELRCEHCDYTEKVEAGEHSYKWRIVKKAGKLPGLKLATCEYCGDYDFEIINAIASEKVATGICTYSGKKCCPSVVVKDSNGTTLKKGVDYTCTYGNNVSIGKGSVYINYQGRYSGTKTLNFTIAPKGTSLSKLTAASKAFTAKWTKQTYKTSGYKIQYSLKSSMSGAKTVKISGASNTSKKISKLKSKKTYYVRICTYKTVSGTDYCSGWSKIKSIKTK